jgi:catechol 2,3-dioxygenase-like lactoylglutathione lyase family enzyme
MMLSEAKLQTIVWSQDIARSEAFYSDVLGLALTGRSHGALVYEVGNSRLRISPVPKTGPSEHTVAGFEVADVEAIVEQLLDKHVRFERFPDFAHADNGIWQAPDGTKVAWFRDPDGNLLSIVTYAA